MHHDVIFYEIWVMLMFECTQVILHGKCCASQFQKCLLILLDAYL